MVLRRIGIAAALTVALTANAEATDLYSVVDPVPSTVAYDDGFDWEGFYAGVFGGPYREDTPYRGVTFGKLVGYNWVTGDLLVGVRATGWFLLGTNDPGNFWYLSADARAGVLIGDALLAYGVVGGGVTRGANNPAGGPIFHGGGGLEFAATDNVTLFAEALADYYFDGSFCCGYDVRVGAAWHFN